MKTIRIKAYTAEELKKKFPNAFEREQEKTLIPHLAEIKASLNLEA